MSDEDLKSEFLRRCRFLLETRGEIHEASVNLPRMGSVTVGPVVIRASGENWEEIDVRAHWPSLPPASSPIIFLRVNPDYPDRDFLVIPIAEEYIKVLKQWMVLDDLAAETDDPAST